MARFSGYPSTDMKSSALSYLPTLPPLSTRAAPIAGLPARQRWPVRFALWLLDRPRLGQAVSVKQFAGRLLKQPARQGVVLAQSRLGQLLCRDCGNPRDRRIGLELLRQAARAGHHPAQQELAQLCRQPWALGILPALKN